MTEGLKEPTSECRYKAKRDGLYYNGYMSSIDCAYDSFDEAWKKIADELKADIEKESK
jgi:hypothetical protein